MSVPVPPRPDLPDGSGRLPPATWRAREAIPVFFGTLVVSAVAGLVLQAAPSCSARFVLPTLIGEIAFGVVTVLWIRYVNHGDLSALGLRGGRPVGDVGSGLAAGLGLVIVAGLVLAVSTSLVEQVVGHPVDQPQQVISCVRGVWLAALGPVVVIAAPFGEEVFFRGFVYGGLRRRYSIWVAAAISGVVFGLVHFAGLDFLLIVPSLMVVGIGLALLYEWRQSLLASMAAHAAFNLVGYVFIARGR